MANDFVGSELHTLLRLCFLTQASELCHVEVHWFASSHSTLASTKARIAAHDAHAITCQILPTGLTVKLMITSRA